MKKLLLFSLSIWGLQAFAQKQVVITIDDLISNGRFRDLTHIQQVNKQIVDTASTYQVPAIGFVNEAKLFKDAGEEIVRTQILKDWLVAGMDLGNHTYSHPSFYKTPLETFKQEVLKGEKVTKKLLEESGSQMRYFRHPFLNTGPDSTTKAQFETFLTEHDYIIAPVTVESSDYVFNKLYSEAVLKNDVKQMHSIGSAYVSHTMKMFDWFEEVTDKTIGHSIPQIYLCHVNPLNADYLGIIYSELAKRGYTFITLEEALQHQAYQQTDQYTGAWGVSWLYRWDGQVKQWLMNEPEVDPEILKQYNQ